jgi:hypothetical protein
VTGQALSPVGQHREVLSFRQCFGFDFTEFLPFAVIGLTEFGIAERLLLVILGAIPRRFFAW